MLPSFVPAHKCDDKAIELLRKTEWSEARPYAMALMEWLEDINSPHFNPIYNYLMPHIHELAAEFCAVFATDDDVWKTNCIYLLEKARVPVKDPPLLAMLLRMAENPTTGEIYHDTSQAARELAQEWNLL
ncbi:DUF5071 domain-containing protein [Chitinophaga caseinilytica]|jgi:hypothetical protein|uniref:DUF5071 domain-containing protein n=1 Tax=Chitinophaga caseinilytica TaxID=2267521 RepID=A0ABZ2Z3I8_9BACT